VRPTASPACTYGVRHRTCIAARLAILALGGLAGPASRGAIAEPVPGIRQPAPPVAGPGSLALPFPAVREEVFVNPEKPEKKVHVFAPAGATLPAKAPVVLFLHGFGAQGPEGYRLWLEHMAKRGCLVVYPVYAALEAPGGLSRYDTMWAGFEEGVRRLARGTPAPDLERLGVVGHSFGGGAAPAMAARAAVRGYGAKGLYVECWAPWFDLDRDAWAALPAHTHLLVGAFEGDQVCDPRMAARFPERAVHVPADHKAFRLARSDDHGTPALRADHMAPLCARETDALDTHCIWRLDDATCALCAGTAETTEPSPFSTAAGALSLGAWSDGTPIAPLLDAMPADSPGALGRVRASYREGGALERGFRRILDGEAHGGLPLPSPAVVPTSKLLRSERLMATPPESLPPTKPDQPTVFLAPGAAVAPAALDSWKAAGIAVVSVPASDDLADTLTRNRRATALLLGRDRVPLLWKPADDPNLGAAVIDVARAK